MPIRRICQLLVLITLSACSSDVTSPNNIVPPEQAASEPTIIEDLELPTVEDPYPIRMHWGQCPQRNGYDGCTLLDDPRATYGNMIVDAAEDVVAEWSRVLHPTPRTPWVAPREGWDRNWPDRNTPPHLWGIVPGDTVPPGLDMFIMGVTDQEGCGWSCATGHPVYPPGGQRHPDDLVRMVKVVVDSRLSDPDDQRWVTLHETGHAIAMSGLGNRDWDHDIVKLPLNAEQRAILRSLWPDRQSDSVYVQSHPAITEIYERYGGGEWAWIGKEVGVAMDPHGWSHWNDCSAPQDVMGPWYFQPGIGPRQRTWISPLTAVAATIHGGFAVDLEQVQPADYHLPDHWSSEPDCQALIP